MNEMKKAHDVFAQIWRMFNNVRKDNSDASWAACVNEVDRIVKANPEPMYKKILVAVVQEAEANSRLQSTEQRMSRYQAAAKAFNESWRLYESLMTCLDVNAVAAYCNDNPGKMARKLGAAVYEAACGAQNVTGTFAEEAYTFYAKYQNGIRAESFSEAEEIMTRHPEYTLQMIHLYDGLKKSTEASASKAA